LSEVLTLFKEHERNREWFEENRETLVEKYDGKFIAIHERSVVDFDKDIGKLMERVHRFQALLRTVRRKGRERLLHAPREGDNRRQVRHHPSVPGSGSRHVGKVY